MLNGIAHIYFLAIRRHACVICLSLLAGCSTVLVPSHDEPPPASPTLRSSGTPQSESLGDEIAIRAIALVGRPYRYGGADLEGFDCSGLVYFIHEQLGLEAPRTAAEQQRASMAVKRGDLEPGDLLFFRTRGRGISHVGIYVGENRFIHAPQSGRLIELRSLDDPYYERRWIASGRLWPAS